MAVSYDQLREGEVLRPPADLPEPSLTVNAQKVLERRYLHRIDNRLVETPGGGFWRVAEDVARGGASWIDPQALELRTREYYGAMASLEFLPNSPTLMNAGKRNGLQYSACYVLPVEDSMDAIFESVKRAALIHKSGGGTGMAFSRLRPMGDIVGSTGGVASGPVSFMEVFNGATESVKQGGCVVPDTMVTTNRGIIPIRELGPADAPADSWHRPATPLMVATDDGARAADEFYNHGLAPIRRIRTRHGYHLAATLEHRIRVIDEAGGYVWRHLKDLRRGDWVVLQKGHLLEPEDYRLPPLAAAPHPNATPVRIPDETSAPLGEFIGYAVGDGAFNRYNRGGGTGRLILTVADSQPEVADRLRHVGQELFGVTPVVQKKAGDGSTNYFFNATTLINWLQQIGVDKPSAAAARVPALIFRQGQRMACGFLRGLFTADGTVSADGYPSLSSVSPALVDDVQQLLLAVGIPSSVSVVTNRQRAFGTRPLYRLRVVTRAGCELFAQQVGFIDTRRAALVTRTRNQAWEFNDVIPHQGAVLAAAYAGPGRGSGPMRGTRGADRALYRDIQHYLPAVQTSRNLTRSRLTTLLDKHEAIRNSALVTLLTRDQFYDQVEAIEEGESLTLDLSVPANNTYVANGFVSHNTRRGANMGILRIDHPDVLHFIDCKRVLRDGPRAAYEAAAPELSPAGRDALKMRLLETQISNFNISLAVTDRFMEALAADGEYELIHPRSGDVVKRLRARDVFDRMVQAAWETGDPGIVFIDRINAGPANPVPAMGPVEATNPCGEQPLYPNEACNLGSINLARFVRPGGVQVFRGGRGLAGVEALDWERMERTARLAIRFLDDVITVNPYPDDYIDRAVKANRRVGLGVMGWADLLIDLEIPYDSEDALRLGTEVMRRLNEWAHDESCRLAEERGPFPNWPKSIYKDGRSQRNATVTTIAPTGTISIISGCSSGVEPMFALAFDRKGSLDGQLSIEVYERFTEVAKREGFWTEDLARQVLAHGTVRGLDSVPEKWQRVFGTAHDIHPDWHVRMQGAFQQHTDNAVSKTINLPHDAQVDDVERAYTLAYEAGCSGITVYRDGSKEGVLHAGGGGGAHGAAAPAADGRTMLARPKAMEGLTYSVETPLGTAYITVNHDEKCEPREVFVNQGKAGSDIAPLSEAIGKLASIVLRVPSPMPPSERLLEITRRLRGIGGSTSLGFGPERTRSLPDALAKVLEEYLDRPRPAPSAAPAAPLPQAAPTTGTAHANDSAALNGNGHTNGHANGHITLHGPRITGDLCPDCGTALVYEEGCSKCMGCGYARC